MTTNSTPAVSPAPISPAGTPVSPAARTAAPTARRSTVRRMFIAGTAVGIGLASLAGTGFVSPAAAAPADPAAQAQSQKPVRDLRGKAVIDRLGSRIDIAARKAGMSPDKLEAELVADDSLHLDDMLNPLYTDVAPPSDTALGTTASGTATTPPYSTASTFALHSRSGSTKKIYLDFTGHQLSGTEWNRAYTGGASQSLAAFNAEGVGSTFTTAEHARIQRIWQSVREDFAAFDVDVTTQDPGLDALRRSSATDTQYGTRVVITPTNFTNCSCGGKGYVGSFDWAPMAVDTPAFVFTHTSNGEKFIAEAVSHEAGHTLGLNHDGVTNGTAYYTGHADWAPIMGVGYYKPVTQWSMGQYAGANNAEADFTVMAANGLARVADDHLGTTATTSTLPAGTIRTGIIGTGGDVDVFKFSLTGTRTIRISAGTNANPAYANLNLRAILRNSAGSNLVIANPSTSLGTDFTVTLPAGVYYLSLNGHGNGADGTVGYTSYGSNGAYRVVLNWA